MKMSTKIALLRRGWNWLECKYVSTRFDTKEECFFIKIKNLKTQEVIEVRD